VSSRGPIQMNKPSKIPDNRNLVVAPQNPGSTTVDSSFAQHLRSLNPERRLDGDVGKTTLPSRRAADIFHRPLDRRKEFAGAIAAANLEKAPPGTRTKMLKIIYDHKAQFSKQRQRTFLIKGVVALAIILGTYIVAKKTWDLVLLTANKTAEIVNVDEWWRNVTKAGRKPVSRPQIQPTAPATNAWRSAPVQVPVQTAPAPVPAPRKIYPQTYKPAPAAKPVYKKPAPAARKAPVARRPLKKSRPIARKPVKKASSSGFGPIVPKSSFENSYSGSDF
jgi:hypothetical protein